jgi:hypothetical protein
MEIKINKDIRQYSEAVFFGLSLRQCIFVGLGGAIGVTASVFLYRVLPLEILSILCVFIAAPFASFGFIRYHGMSLEKLIAAYIRQGGAYARPFVYRAAPYYVELLNSKQESGKPKKGKGK